MNNRLLILLQSTKNIRFRVFFVGLCVILKLMREYFLSLFVLIAVLLAHLSGLNGLYIQIQYFDVIIHILGGVGLGLLFHGLISRHGSMISHKRLALIGCVLVAGLVWEAFEIYYDIARYPVWTQLYYVDTLKDIVDDLIGGGIVAYFISINKREERSVVK